MNKISVAIIGLGQRGYGITKLLCDSIFDLCEITVVCDVHEDRVEAAKQYVFEKTGKTPYGTLDYNTITKDIAQAALVITGWEAHTKIAIHFLEKGIAVGMEVGGANALQECFDLVSAQERTQTPFMFLENCNYGKYERMVLNMVKQGMFGEIVHCEGGYHHDIRTEILKGQEERHYRLKQYLERNCENYPTHELGPICQVLNINRGNRLVSLTSTASKSRGLNDYAIRHDDIRKELQTAIFNQGDIVTTVIKCQNGETITLTLDTDLPRPYSRAFTVRGTRGMYQEDGNFVFLDDDVPVARKIDYCYNNANEYFKDYMDPIWKEYTEAGIVGGHDGMDYLVYSTFFKCLINGDPMPIDVYDGATLMSIAPLSEMSIQNGSKEIEIPDFKNLKA